MAAKIATVYLDSELNKAVRTKAEAENLSVSEVIADALRQTLVRKTKPRARRGDAKIKQPFLTYQQAIETLKKQGFV